MSEDSLEARLRKVEVRFAYLSGAAVVGLSAILAFWGLTSWETIPSAVEKEVRAQIGEETLLNITEAGEKARSILSASKLQEDIVKLQSTQGDRANTAAISVSLGEVQRNTSRGPLLVVGWCGAREVNAGGVTIEGKIGATNNPGDVVASGSGFDRRSITFVVPPQWYYLVTQDIPWCSARAWAI